MATIDDVFDNEKRNDVSFLYKDKLVVMIEHQSTISENMPLRMLLYIAKYYDKHIKGTTI